MSNLQTINGCQIQQHMIKPKIDCTVQPLSINQIKTKLNKHQQQEIFPDPVIVKPKRKKIKTETNVYKPNTNIVTVQANHQYTKSQDYQEIYQHTNRQEKKKISNKDTPIYQFFQSSNKQNIDSKIDDSSFSINNSQTVQKMLKSQQEASQVNYWMSMAKKYHNLLTSEKIKTKNVEQKMRVQIENAKYGNKVQIQQLQRRIQTLSSQVVSKNKQIKEKQDLIARILAKKQHQTV